MQIIIRLIIPVLISIVLGGLFYSIEKRNSKELINNLTKEHITVRMPKAYIWVGFFGILFFVACVALMICFPNGTEAIWVYVLFCMFILLGVSIVWATLIWKIEIFRNKDYFLLRTVALRTYKIQYCECIGFKRGNNTLVLKTSKGTFRVESNATNFECFMSMLTQHKIKGIK